MKTISLLSALLLTLTGATISAQNGGILKGNVTDEKGQPMLFATVAILNDTVILTGTTTDEHGDYSLKHLTPGKYNLRFSFVGYKARKIKEVLIEEGQTAYVNAKMVPDNMLGPVVITEKYEKPIINPTYSTVTSINTDQIEHMAVQKGDIISMIVNMTPGVMETPDGSDLYVRGSRSGSTAYYIDGNRIMGSPEVPGRGIASMEVLTGGVPAEYGDCTGGLVIITTKDYKVEMQRKEIKRRDKLEAEAEAAAAKEAKENGDE